LGFKNLSDLLWGANCPAKAFDKHHLTVRLIGFLLAVIYPKRADSENTITSNLTIEIVSTLLAVAPNNRPSGYC
jgi:hypothetical protein